MSGDPGAGCDPLVLCIVGVPGPELSILWGAVPFIPPLGEGNKPLSPGAAGRMEGRDGGWLLNTQQGLVKCLSPHAPEQVGIPGPQGQSRPPVPLSSLGGGPWVL